MTAIIISNLASFFLAYQDFKDREVYVLLFPIIFISGLAVNLTSGLGLVAIQILQNLLFLSFIFLLVLGYFKIKYGFKKQILNLVGAGDLLFLVSISPYFSLRQFILFLCVSFTLSLIFFIPFNIRNKAFQIPLAGFQAIHFALFFTLGYFYPNLYSGLIHVIF